MGHRIRGRQAMKKHGKRFGTARDPHAATRALVGVQQLDGSQTTDLSLAYRMALECLRTGNGVESHVHTLACASNIALVLAERGYGADSIDAIKLAQDGILRCFSRHQRSGKYGLDGEAIQAITSLCSLHDAQIRIARQKHIREAIAEVHKRMDKGDVLGVAE
jgi:hypothetical protein